MKPDRQTGAFTLIEVIVAMTITAAVMASSMLLFKSSIDGVNLARTKTFAAWVGQNYAVALNIEKSWPDIGKKKSSETKMGNATWYIDAVAEPTLNRKFRKVTIKVFTARDSTEEVFSTYAYIAKP